MRLYDGQNSKTNKSGSLELQPYSNGNRKQTGKSLMEQERNSKAQTITAEELITANFRSVMKDKELKEKLEKADQKI